MMKNGLRRAWSAGAVCLILLLAGGAAAAAQPGADACTRADLYAATDKFFAALEAHDPALAPLAAGVKYTENGLEVAVGKGVWETAGKTTFKRRMADTRKCGTHTQAILDEQGSPLLYGVRLKVEKGKISEIEAILARGKEALDVPAILATKDHDWESVLPPAERSSRLSMIAAADDYFELFVKEQKPQVSEIAYSGICDRWENGMQTTKGGMNQGVAMPEHNCSPKGFSDMKHPFRRFLVDEETGVVVAYVLFNNVWPDFHMFRMRNGRVELIQAYFEYGKTYKTIGWPYEPACD